MKCVIVVMIMDLPIVDKDVLPTYDESRRPRSVLAYMPFMDPDTPLVDHPLIGVFEIMRVLYTMATLLMSVLGLVVGCLTHDQPCARLMSDWLIVYGCGAIGKAFVMECMLEWPRLRRERWWLIIPCISLYECAWHVVGVVWLCQIAVSALVCDSLAFYVMYASLAVYFSDLLIVVVSGAVGVWYVYGI